MSPVLALVLAASAFVQADVARVRESADANAKVLARLRIGARVEVAKTEGEWSQVSAPMSGFISAEMLGPKKPKLDALLKKAKAATGGEQAKWLERAVALDGTRKDNWVALRKTASGEKAKAIDSLLAGKAPVYVAACYQQEWTVLAAYVPGRGFGYRVEEPGADEEEPRDDETEASKKRRAVAEALAIELGGASWFTAAGKPVDAELLGAHASEVKSIDGRRHYVKLGACSPKGALLFSVPPALAPKVKAIPKLESDHLEEEQSSYTDAFELEVKDGEKTEKLSVTVMVSGC